MSSRSPSVCLQKAHTMQKKEDPKVVRSQLPPERLLKLPAKPSKCFMTPCRVEEGLCSAWESNSHFEALQIIIISNT